MRPLPILAAAVAACASVPAAESSGAVAAGPIGREEPLADSRWAIVSIDALAVDGDDYFLDFSEDRLSGRAGCNGFSGPWSQSGDTLVVGTLAATRRACPWLRMEHERRALAVLRGSVRTERRGDVLLLDGDGGTIELRRRR